MGEEDLVKERSFWVAALVGALIWVGVTSANAQTSPSPNPAATPTPLASITTLPNGQPVNCLTGAEPPPSFLGVSGGNINSISLSKTGTVSCSAGTLGALVEDSSGNQYVLSTNKVLARVSGKKGAKPKEAIVQPGLEDLGCWQATNDTVAALSKWVPITFGRGTNQMDAAIAKVVPALPQPSATPTAGVYSDGRILNLGVNGGPEEYFGYVSTTPFPPDQLIDGLPVMKMGRSSCLTAGKIDAWDAMGLVSYSGNSDNQASTGLAFFDHQILVLGADPKTGAAASFASTGDSGSLVVTLNQDFDCPQAIGLVFAGASGATADSGGEIVAVSPIEPILSKFGVTLVGDSMCTPSILERQVGGVELPADISDTLRSSIEQVRAAKAAYGRRLLRVRGVAAVGIGAGDTSDSVALNVYLTEDNARIRNRVAAELRGSARIRFRRLAARFTAL